jgi:hypothetical protein
VYRFLTSSALYGGSGINPRKSQTASLLFDLFLQKFHAGCLDLGQETKKIF